MALPSTYSERRLRLAGFARPVLLAAGIALSVFVVSCGREKDQTTSAATQDDKKWDRGRAESEYRLMQTELTVAKSDSAYMVLDFKRHELKIKQKGAVVWSYPMTFATKDSEAVGDFLDRFLGQERRFMRPLANKYLFSARGKTPDSVLAIVGEVVKVEPGTLQRELPQRFQFEWADGLVLEVQTDVAGKPISKFQNAIIEIGQALNRPFGGTSIVLKVSADEALTLYRATQPGMPTLVYPL